MLQQAQINVTTTPNQYYNKPKVMLQQAQINVTTSPD